MGDQIEIRFAEPKAWSLPKGKHTCGRDPEAGPGTCWHWWEGCPDGEKRGCYLLWLKSHDEAGKAGS